jgi:hypothetical protein
VFVCSLVTTLVSLHLWHNFIDWRRHVSDCRQLRKLCRFLRGQLRMSHTFDHYCKQDIRAVSSHFSRPVAPKKLIALLNHTSRCKFLANRQRQLSKIIRVEQYRAKMYLTACYRYGCIAFASCVVSALFQTPLLFVTVCLQVGHAILLTLMLGFPARRTKLWNAVTAWQGRGFDVGSDRGSVIAASEFLNLGALTAAAIVLPIWQGLNL